MFNFLFCQLGIKMNHSVKNYTVMIHTLNALLYRDPNSTDNISFENFEELIDSPKNMNHLTNHIGFSLETFTFISKCADSISCDIIALVKELEVRKNFRFNFLNQSMKFVCFRNLLDCCTNDNCPYMCKSSHMTKIHQVVKNIHEEMLRPPVEFTSSEQKMNTCPTTQPFGFTISQPFDGCSNDKQPFGFNPHTDARSKEQQTTKKRKDKAIKRSKRRSDSSSDSSSDSD
jgi:hypothetical protein